MFSYMFSYVFLKPYLIDVFPGGRPPSSDRHPACRTMSADTFIDVWIIRSSKIIKVLFVYGPIWTPWCWPSSSYLPSKLPQGSPLRKTWLQVCCGFPWFSSKSSHRTLHTLCVFWQSGAPGTTSEHASKPAGRAFESTLSS